ncbi:U1 zinc finger domain-containing protein [Histoplasma capsulatum H143]|uniref:U1 zinc finger domain-containing protein n=1 Tax=Ajellomyces capsulatus (strain H143) TaxID=544712 RepID=C6HJ29_AJECH|nr:U1 zinc finger domain-containing protein [Histoplasma capsulatum H143]
MSEYWKSTPKYWCKHCKTYVRDTAFERTQHEATGKHQGNLRRFLRDIHRNNERDERKNQQARNEIERLKGVVSGSSKTGEQQRPPWKHGLGGGSGAGPATGANAESSASLSANAEQRKRRIWRSREIGKLLRDTAEEKGHEQDPMAGLNIGVRKRKLKDRREEAAGETVMRKGWGSTTRAFPDDGKDIDALLERATELKRKGPKMETPDVKAEREGVVDGSIDIATRKENPAANDGDVPPIKREERGNGSTIAGTKEKGDAKDVSRSASEALGETSEGIVPAVVFKKRKPKHAR